MHLANETGKEIRDSKYQSKSLLNFVKIEITNGDLAQANFTA